MVAFFHPIVINRINNDESIHVNTVSHTRFKHDYNAKSLGENSHVNLEAYRRTSRQEKINSKNLYESSLENSLDSNEFNDIKSKTIYK